MPYFLFSFLPILEKDWRPKLSITAGDTQKYTNRNSKLMRTNESDPYINFNLRSIASLVKISNGNG